MKVFVYQFLYRSCFWSLLIILVGTNDSIANDKPHAKTQAKSLGIAKQRPKSGRFVKVEQGYMVPYKTKIPGSEVTFEMVPIPGGTFMLGSPKSEKGREKCEGPQVKVTIEPFWMGKHEITWAEYQQYMQLHEIFKEIQNLRIYLKHQPKKKEDRKELAVLQKMIKKHPALKKQITQKTIEFDAVTAPSDIYDPDYPYQNGNKPKLPAVTMSQYAAKQYTKWLSRTTGNFHRLPSEAQWEYACRAGSKTAYHCGDDIKKLADYAWFNDNSKDTTHPVGSKKPNAWGLYDMHGNVAEWVLDGFEKKGYQKSKGEIAWPTKLFPRVIRGGSYEFEAKACRSASRFASNDDDDWRDEDADNPQSPYWFTTEPSQGIGFRIIRPLTTPKSKTAQERYWKPDIKKIADDVAEYLNDGHGTQGNVNQQLPKVIKLLPLPAGR